MKTTLIILSVLLSAPNSFSQSTPQALGTLIERALASSYGLKAEQQKILAARKTLQYDHSQALPQFSSELAREQRYLQPYNFRSQWALLRGEWSFGDFLLKSDRVAQQDVLAASELKEQTRLDVTMRIASLYLGVLQTEAGTDLLQQHLQLLQAHLDVTRALWQAGTRTELDVLQTESERSQLQEQLTLLKIGQENFLRALEQLINWPTADTLQIAHLDATAICAQPAPTFSEETLESNPALRALDFQISSQRFRMRSIHASQIPKFHISGGYVQDADPTGDGNYWQVDAGIEMPIFRWGATKFQRQKSQASLMAMQSHRQEEQRNLEIRVTQTLDKLRKLKDVMSLRDRRLRTDELAFQLADANYRAGLITNLEYLSAQQKFSETQIDIQGIQLEYIMNLIDYYILTNQVEKIKEIAAINSD